MTKKKNLVIKSKSAMPLQIFEAADSTPVAKKYVFKGVFTACSTPDHVVVNRNNRVYGEQEVLRHLSYLRENIQQNGFILGELDHPIDRFDTQMKEASHKITDLWYDQPTHCVMGKLELLDTPNGRIARTLIDSGYPLFVSSRAAGEVDQRTKEVHIEQIFTYDIVCTPGFQEARLERVEESLSLDVRNYLNESLDTIKKDKNVTEKYGVLLEGVCVNESSVEAPVLSDKAKMAMENADINALSKPMLKEDEEFKLPEANLDPNADDNAVKENNEDNTNNDNNDSDNKDNNDNKDDNASSSDSDNNDENKDDNKSEKKELTDEEKKEKRAGIISIEAFNTDGENTTEEEKEENREKVVDIEGVPADDENKSDDDNDDKSDSNDDNDVPGEDVEQTDECDGSTATTQEDDADNASECGGQEECGPGEVKVKDGSKDQKDAEKVLNDADKSEDIKKQTEKDMDKYEELIKKAKKLADVKESIVKAYNFSISLSPENFAKFAALKPVDKNKVQKYIVEHQIMDVKTINEQWTTPLVEEKRNKKNWLRLAPKEYREAYAKADIDVQDAIEESAKFVNIQTANDAQRFWERTGLLHQDEYLQKSLTEQFKITESEDTNLNESAVRSQNLGYSVDYMGMLEQMADAGMI